MVITTTAMSTMIVELTTSFLVGQATLRSSPFTSPRYCWDRSSPAWVQPTAAGASRRRTRTTWACRCPASPSCAWSVGSSPRRGRPRARGQVVVRCRAGGTRTPNRRFWRPVLYQFELLPSGRGRAGTERIAASPGRPRRSAGDDRDVASAGRDGPAARPVHDHHRRRSPGGDRRAADGPDVGEPTAVRIDRTAWRSPASSIAARVWASRPGRARGSGCAAAAGPGASCGTGRARPGSAGTTRCGAAPTARPPRRPRPPRAGSGRPRHTACSRLFPSGLVVVEEVAQALAPAVQAYLGRGHRDPELLGDLLVRQAVDVLEHHQHPQLGRQVLERPGEPGQRGRLLRRLLGLGLDAGLDRLLDHGVEGVGPVAPTALHRGVRGVRGDAVQPRGELRVATEAARDPSRPGDRSPAPRRARPPRRP